MSGGEHHHLHHTTIEEVRAKPNFTLGVLLLGALAYTLAQTMVIPALPEIQHQLGVDAADVTWLVTAFLLAASVATPIVGRLGDMYGKHRLLLISLVIFGIGNLIAALAHTLPIYVLARVIQGCGGAILPLAIGVVRDEFPREKVATGIGTLSAMFGIGGGVALILSGVLVETIGVDSIFYVSLVVSAIAAVATWRFVPESPVRVNAPVDYLGGVLMATGLTAVLFGISEGNHWGWLGGRVLGLFSVGVLILVAFTLWELRTPAPLIDMRLMRRRAVWTVNLAAFTLGFALFGSYILIPQIVQTASSVGYGFDASVVESGLFLMPGAILMLIAGPYSGRLSTRHGSRLPLALGAGFSTVAYLSLALLHDEPWQILMASALVGLGIGLSFAAMANLVVDAVPQNQTGVAVGVNTIIRSIGGAIGGQVTAAVLTATIGDTGLPTIGGYSGAYAIAAVAGAIAMASTALVPRSSNAADQARNELHAEAAQAAGAEGAPAPATAETGA